MKEAIKKFIIEKAKGIFKDKGFKNATMDKIAEVSDISKPTLYKYFPSKEELFHQVLISINDEIDREILSSLNPEDSIFKNMKLIILKTIEFLLKHKQIMRIALFETGSFFKNSKDKKLHFQTIFKNRAKRKEFLINLIKEGQNNGAIRKDLDPEFLAISYLGIMKEISFEIIFLDLKIKDTEKVAENIVEVIINGIKKRG